MNLNLKSLAGGLAGRPAPRLLLVAAGLGGVLAATASTAVTHASGGIPASCNGLVQQYLHSKQPNGATAGFTMVSDATNEVAGYAEGTLFLDNGGWNGHYFRGPSLSTTTYDYATQYFSDRRESEPDDGYFGSSPFSDENTDKLGLSIWEPPFGGSLNATLTLASWGNGKVQITVQGCVGNNVLYGTTSSGGANTGAVVISLGPLEWSPPPK